MHIFPDTLVSSNYEICVEFQKLQKFWNTKRHNTVLLILRDSF